MNKEIFIKMNITILPLKGIIINNSSNIIFGQSLDEIEFVLNQKYTQVSNKYYLFDNNLCLEFDGDNKLVFIEISNCDIITPCLFGQNPFTLLDKELIPFLHRYCHISEDIPLNINKVTDYVIKSKSLSIYRQTCPYKMLASIEDAKSEGYYNPNMDFDYFSSYYFDAVGIGEKGYFE